MQKDSIDPKILEEMYKFGQNMLKIPQSVPAPSTVNLECTPYDVEFTKDKVRLLHYRPLVKTQVKTPIVIAYAIINRFHILDISAKKSWIRNLLEQGFDVYLIDWGMPTDMDKFLDIDDYVNDYLDECVNAVCDETSVNNVSLQGYCTGGTLATIYTTLHPKKVRNFVVTAPVIDGWKDTTVVSNLAKNLDIDKFVDVMGNMPPEFMQFCFSILKPFEQGLDKYGMLFRNIEDEKFVESFMRIEKWLNDVPPVPGELFRQWIKEIYQKNNLIQSNMKVNSKKVLLKNISMPVFTQVAVGDHLVSPECSMPLHYAIGSDDKTMQVYPTGHVGMIASRFSQGKVLPEMGQWLKQRSEKN